VRPYVARLTFRTYAVTRKTRIFLLRIERFFVRRTKKRSIREIFDPWSSNVRVYRVTPDIQSEACRDIAGESRHSFAAGFALNLGCGMAQRPFAGGHNIGAVPCPKNHGKAVYFVEQST
jgi:hypothetical protein